MPRVRQESPSHFMRRVAGASPQPTAALIAVLVAVMLAAAIATALGVRALMAAPTTDPSRVALQSRVDALLAHGLAIGMFEREYGVVQQLLGDYVSTGHLERAVVLDDKRRVVAAVAPPAALRVGAISGGEVPDGARLIALELRAQRFGELLAWMPDEAARPAAADRSVSIGLAAIALLGWFAAAVIGMRLAR